MYSTNERAEKIVGKRDIPENTMVFDYPQELDYHCPVCKYDNVVDWEFDGRLDWSEYNGFIYCHTCDKDYPSCLCQPDIDKAIDTYLDCVDAAQNAIVCGDIKPLPTP